MQATKHVPAVYAGVPGQVTARVSYVVLQVQDVTGLLQEILFDHVL